MPDTPNHADPPKPRRRWFQFRLRTLLIVVAICALFAGWFRHKLEQSRLQAIAVKALEAAGRGQVSIVYDDEPPGPYWTMGKNPPQAFSLVPNWIKKLFGRDFLCDVVEVDIQIGMFGGGPVSDPVIKSEDWQPLTHLQRLSVSTLHSVDSILTSIPNPSELRKLDVVCSDIDKSLPWMARFKRLQSLTLAGATDEGLTQIEALTDLTELNVSSDEIGDMSMAKIGRLHRLKTLNISSAKISNRSIPALDALSELEELHLAGTKISASGFGNLEACTNLRSLELGGAVACDAILAQLPKFKHLTDLALNGGDITDASLSQLSRIEHLENLSLRSGDNITDAGVDALEQLKGLKTLDFFSNAVSWQRVQKLQKALPKTTISYGVPG